MQLAELAGDEREAVLALGCAVQPLELVCDPVEPLEQGVELAVTDVVLFHAAILRTRQEVVTRSDDDGVGAEPVEQAFQRA